MLPASGDVGIEPFSLTNFKVGGAAVAGIRNQGIR